MYITAFLQRCLPLHYQVLSKSSNLVVSLHSPLVEVTEGLLPDQEGVDQAALNGRLNVVDWLITKEIWPDSITLISCGRLDLLKYLVEKGMSLSPIDAYAALRYNQTEIQEWLEEMVIYPPPNPGIVDNIAIFRSGCPS